MNPDQVVQRYITDVTNEPDSERRHRVIDEIVGENLHYVDQDGAVDGREAFKARIDELAAMMGSGARFTLARPLQRAENAVIYHWELGAPGRPPVLSGTDVLVVENGVIARLWAVTDD